MKGIRAKLDYVLKHNSLISKSFRCAASLGIRTLGLFVPIDKRAIIFSGHSRKYNDSPRAIYEYMISCPEFKNYKFYWALEDPANTEIPGRCKKIKSDTLEYFIAALMCKYWITCVNIERGLKFKRKNNVYLNTWHGIPIKTVGNCAEGRNDYDFSYIDYFCVSGDYEIDVYRKSFNVPETHVVKTGMPRNDELYHITLAEINTIKTKLNIPLDKKVILYAPTWRDSKDGGKSYRIKPPINMSKWENELGNDYVLLFRTHPYTNELLGISFNSFVRDYTDYPKINDLMKISDILISDYSATIFDYSILERPIISFAYDYKLYSKDRGFALNICEEMPGGICQTENEVINRILNMDYEKEKSEVKTFKNKYLSYGGHATEICVRKLFKN